MRGTAPSIPVIGRSVPALANTAREQAGTVRCGRPTAAGVLLSTPLISFVVRELNTIETTVLTTVLRCQRKFSIILDLESPAEG
jgi:hypothetical protein